MQKGRHVWETEKAQQRWSYRNGLSSEREGNREDTKRIHSVRVRQRRAEKEGDRVREGHRRQAKRGTEKIGVDKEEKG